jgi:hypothetical protein
MKRLTLLKSMIDFDKCFFNAGDSYKKGFTEKDADAKSLKKGIEEEMEHTTNKKIAKKQH